MDCVRIHLATDIFLKHSLGEKKLDKLLRSVVDCHEEAHEDFCHSASHCIEYLYTNIIRPDTLKTQKETSLVRYKLNSVTPGAKLRVQRNEKLTDKASACQVRDD